MHRLKQVICGLALSAVAQLTLADQAKKTIVIAGDDYCPLSCNPASGQNGFAYEFAQQLYGQLGWEVRYEFVPFQRALKYFKEGRVDLIPGAAKDDNPHFAQAALSSVAVMSPRMCFYTRAQETWTYQSTASLLQGRLGVIAGYFYWPELLSYIAQHQNDGKVDSIAADNPIELSMRKLKAGRFDYFAELRPAVEYQLMKLRMKEAIREANCVLSLPLHMAFRPDFAGAKELNAHWDKHYLQFLKSPQGIAILQKYGLSIKSIME
ncbi:substrate-binding periplasmic protein [Undibacterium parvum]|uniref:Transporter substrate-binding domain-containing protein n=2 Tax=Undibacterium TaxID=401469 RepID=A0A6M4A1G4_9BURK|nr:transporter substrate-binding domain-containing protein [Undibacterium parvum]AZP14046.1 transporter substrate-binding domain-containing protein [Undibacterium parvum]QJQ04994.1 transporter substrate-binding domain-containing protein [Undibacterium piscinae]